MSNLVVQWQLSFFNNQHCFNLLYIFFNKYNGCKYLEKFRCYKQLHEWRKHCEGVMGPGNSCNRHKHVLSFPEFSWKFGVQLKMDIDSPKYYWFINQRYFCNLFELAKTEFLIYWVCKIHLIISLYGISFHFPI